MNKVATRLVMGNTPMLIQDYDRGQANGVPELNNIGKIDVVYFPPIGNTSSVVQVSSEDPTLFINYVQSLL